MFRALRILHLGLLIGLLLFSAIAVFLKSTNQFEDTESLDRPLQVVVILISVPLLVIGFRIFRRKMMEARQMNDIARKRFEYYTSACIVWWAMIEVPAIFAIIAFLLTGNYAFMFLAAFHVLLLLLFMPRKENITVLLNMSSEEMNELG